MPMVRTVVAPLRYEIDKIKGSRFLASVSPISDQQGAERFLELLRREFYDATHNCFAWRVAELMRSSDDGEPSETAGKPILAEIDGRQLIGVAVVVTRYYGGTKLGTGGLIRAYAAAAGAALDRVEIDERPVTEVLQLRYDYSMTSPVQGVLAAYDLAPASAHYGADTQVDLAVPVEQIADLRLALTDATNGSIRISEASDEDSA